MDNNKLFRIIDWLIIRTWHFWGPIILSIIVLGARNYFPGYSCFIMKINAIMQVGGVAILLLILNNNMLALKNTSMLAEFINWWRESPLFKKSIQIVVSNGVLTMSSVGSPYVFGTKKGDTIEERINNLEEEISIIRKNIFDVKNEMIGMINKKEVEYKEKFEDVNKSLKKIKEKIETTVIGDYRWPIFSGNLVINGLILSMIPC